MLHECGRPRSTCGLLGGTCGGGGGATSSSPSSSFSISNLFPSYAPPTTSNSTGSSSGGEGEGLSSYVDCTLSLGTPSTRHAGAGAGFGGPGPAQPPSSLQWDVMGQPNKQQCCGGSGGGGGGCGFSKGNGGDAPRRCANCDTTSTPLWRNGPRGPKSLCNACGIRYKKEERRAATSSAVPPPPPPPLQQQWGCYGAAAAASASKGAVSIAMYGDDGADSWRLNAAAAAQAPQFHVRDWPSLFQYN
ncbi:GATA transcription factor 19 [Ananas comosus]|uniref:GATA transcription factor 19 n=1 Tax=Ananas comosus TaxID=4615 RepID=A0A199UF03_ANACO|nr:GATA transcription factor 19 [Ananas comosus]